MRMNVRSFVAGIILSATFFLLFLDAFKLYKSEISVLVIPKSQVAVENQQIVYNISQFPKMLSFYDKLLRDNKDVKDSTVGNSQDKRKQLWNEYVKVRTDEKKGSAITISMVAKKQSDSEALANKTAKTLINFTSQYYDAKNDLDIRIVDGPISRPVLRGWLWHLIISILLGLGFAMIIENLLNSFVVTNKKPIFNKDLLDSLKQSLSKKDTQDKNKLEALYRKEEIPDEMDLSSGPIEAAEELLEKPKDEPQKFYGTYPNYPEMPKRDTKKASAPDNLPTGNVPENLPFAKDMDEKEEKNDIFKTKDSEPSQEDFKRRLNELLKGK